MPPPFPSHSRTQSTTTNALLVPRNKRSHDAAKDAALLAEWNAKKWVWVPQEREGYVAGWVIKEDGDLSTVALESGDILEPIPTLDLLRVNPPTYEKAEDIADLTYLNEASVVHNLKARYSEDCIYTYSGLFLVAVNPYKTLPIYSSKVVERFKNRRRDENAPHVYAVAEKAWQSMLAHREQSQSILVTGESGAGKTENTKKVIQYLAAIAADPVPASASFDLLAAQAGVLHRQASMRQGLKGGEEVGGVVGKKLGTLERQILEANPILEAFGNAQTVKNNNSSRFGKFVRIYFNPIGAIAGANIDWYLLEKSRVTSRSANERAFHIFFQLLRGADAELKEKLLLTGEARDYEYLKHSRQEVEGMDDKIEWRHLLNALDTVGFTSEEQLDLFRVVAAILHLGNVSVGGTDTAHLPDPSQLERIAHLLGLPDTSDLLNALVRPKVRAGREWVVQARTNKQVVDELAALSKSLYEKNFGKMVERINNALGRPSTKTFIGVLDIAGFEIFQTNGFEQLCINLTNEKLQQFFNHHMFVLEQEEYGREGIDWQFRNFGLELQPTIDLIESNNPMGVLSCLDDACIMPKASDASFTGKMHQLASAAPVATQYTKYSASRIEQGFTISHYAGNVEYRTDGWLDKNRDPLSENLTALLAKSHQPYIASLFAEFADTGKEVATDGPRKRVRKGAFRTVGQRHKDQLAFLMTQLNQTQPHFVRCIVPNTTKTPGVIDTPLVLDQLRCNGVLEGIRIARLGFPNRLPFSEFRRRFEVLVPGKIPKDFIDGKEASRRILNSLELDPQAYQLGLTKVFFKAGVLAELEERRDELLSDIFTRVQAACRMFVARRQANKILNRAAHVRTIQRNARIYGQLKAWPWWPLFQRVRPLLAAARSDDEIRRKEEELASAKAKAEMEEKERERLEALQIELEATQAKMEESLASERSRASEREALLILSKKREAELEEDIALATRDIDEVEGHLNRAMEANKHLEARVTDLDSAVANSNALVRTLQSEQTAWKAMQAELASQTSIKTAEWEAVLAERDSKKAAAQQLHLELMDVHREHDRLTASLADSEGRLVKATRDAAESRKVATAHEADLRLLKDNVASLDREKRDLMSRLQNREAELVRAKQEQASFVEQLEASSSAVRDLEVKLAAAESKASSQARQLDDNKVSAQKSAADLADLKSLLEAKSSDHEKQSRLNRLQEAEVASLKLKASEATSQLATAQRTAADESTRLRQDLEKTRKDAQDLQTKNHDLTRRAASSTARITDLEASVAHHERLQQSHELQVELVRTKAAEDTLREREKWDDEMRKLAMQVQRFEDAALAAQRSADVSARERDALQTRLDAETDQVRQRDATIRSLGDKIDQQTLVHDDMLKNTSELREEMRDLKMRLRLAEDKGGKLVIEHIRVLEETQRIQNAQMEKMIAEDKAQKAYERTLKNAQRTLNQNLEDLQRQLEMERRKDFKKAPPDNAAAKAMEELERERNLRRDAELNVGRLRSEIQQLQAQLDAASQDGLTLRRQNERLDRELTTLAASDYTETMAFPRDRRMQESRAVNVPSPTRTCFACDERAPPESPLLKCSGCRRCFYCTPACQKKDWREHKKVCGTWKKLPELPTEAGVLDRQSLYNSMTKRRLMQEVHDKDLDWVLSELCMKEMRCFKCRLLAPSNIKTCPSCRFTSWCEGCASYEEEHLRSGLCDKFAEMVNDQNTLFDFCHDPNTVELGGILPFSPERLLTKPTSLPASWKDYLAKAGPPVPFGTSFSRLMIEHQLSIVLTAIAAISRLLPDTMAGTTKHETFVLHVVGANFNYEFMAAAMSFEEILHYIPGIKNVRVVFVGPKATTGEGSKAQVEDMGTCPNCEPLGRSRVYEFHPQLYEEYRKDHPTPPDLAIALNCGIHDRNEDPKTHITLEKMWEPALKLIIKEATPIAFTSYNREESEFDVDVLKKLGAAIQWGPEDHVWKDGRVSFDYFCTNGVYRSNDWWIGVKGRAK